LSVETAHTNILLRSQEFDDSAVWNNFGSSSAGLVLDAANSAVAPDGTMTADRLIASQNVTIGAGSYCIMRQTLFAAGGSTYTYSIWLKAGTATSVRMFLGDTLTITTVDVPLTSAWQRFTLTKVQGASVTLYAYLGYADQTANVNGQTFYAWGGQVEQSAFAHSYVATAAATATCNKDEVTVPTAALPVASGLALVTFIPLWSSNAGASLFDSRSSAVLPPNGIALSVAGGTTSFLAGTAANAVDGALAWVAGQSYQLRCDWGAGNMALTRDAVLVVNGAGKTMPTSQGMLRVGQNFSNANQADGYISSLSFASA
jgi:hypothetical protein